MWFELSIHVSSPVYYVILLGLRALEWTLILSVFYRNELKEGAGKKILIATLISSLLDPFAILGYVSIQSFC